MTANAYIRAATASCADTMSSIKVHAGNQQRTCEERVEHRLSSQTGMLVQHCKGRQALYVRPLAGCSATANNPSPMFMHRPMFRRTDVQSAACPRVLVLSQASMPFCTANSQVWAPLTSHIRYPWMCQGCCSRLCTVSDEHTSAAFQVE